MAGTTLSNLDIAGCLSIQANNVVVTNTRIRGTCDPVVAVQGNSVLLEDVEIDGGGSPVVGIDNGGFTCLRCNIHGVETGANIATGAIQDSWIHDLAIDSTSNDVSGGRGQYGLASGMNGVNLIHNALEVDSGQSAVYLGGGYGPITNVVIDDNLLNGGGYTLFGGATNTANVHITNNRFGRKFNSTCGAYGPEAFWQQNPGNVWAGNVWDDTGAPVAP